MRETEDADTTVFDSRFSHIYQQMGHINGSFNVPLSEVLNEDKTFKDPQEILAKFGYVDRDDQVVLTCQAGITACILEVALLSAGHNPEKTSVYDGSWGEYSQKIKNWKKNFI